MNKISVIVPIYNGEIRLRKSLDSIIAQTYEKLEILLIDDGSTDCSEKICDEYAKKDDRVKVIHKKNEGVAVARNSGLRVATGEYCTFVDCDDYIEPVMYQEMMKIADQYDCDVVMCDCVKEFKEKQVIYTHQIRGGYYDRSHLEKEYFQNLLIMPNVEYPPTISNWLCVFKRMLIVENSGKDSLKIHYEEGIRFSEDLLFGAELLYRANSFYYMKEVCFYHYWMNPNSVTHTFTVDKWRDYVQLHGRIKEIFCNCKIYDFSRQVDLVLLFFVYNSIGDILSTSMVSMEQKKKICREILQTGEVKEMFGRLNIWKMPIPFKLKILTLIYKYRKGINLLIIRGNRHNEKKGVIY